MRKPLCVAHENILAWFSRCRPRGSPRPPPRPRQEQMTGSVWAGVRAEGASFVRRVERLRRPFEGRAKREKGGGRQAVRKE
ncbi:hypothetical protein E2C01_081463 [Portunus trituberculatus]|uniref:Uncharacterized protein n=1 Tax=Portunus trituberculatus TaxID=210409 RepID=A0A5B7J180_PORTR|nr:hypothetical protein [Portunus trituberculatus]